MVATESFGIMAVTHQTIADAAGVTRATVSPALRGHPRISAATREHIRRIADDLGYRPEEFHNTDPSSTLSKH